MLFILAALLFEGTAEIALQNLEDLTDYAQEKNKWEGGVRFSVEQVGGLLLINFIMILFSDLESQV